MIMDKKDYQQRDFVILPLSDYVKLDTMAKLKHAVKPTIININDLLFLSALMKELSASYNSELSIINDIVTIKIYRNDGGEIDSAFDLKLCEKYYNKVNKFISEVL